MELQLLECLLLCDACHKFVKHQCAWAHNAYVSRIALDSAEPYLHKDTDPLIIIGVFQFVSLLAK